MKITRVAYAVRKPNKEKNVIQSRTSPPRTSSNGVGIPSPKKFTRSKGITRTSWKTGICGPEGSGKSTLASLCPGVIFADLEHSTKDLDVERVDGITNWFDLRAFVQIVTPEEYPVVCIDSVTRAEDWCAEYVIAHKIGNEGQRAKDSLEDFKYKAGLTFVTDEFKRLLADIDAAFLRGVSFIMVAHNRVSRVRNPDGSDFIRNEPRLLNEEKGGNMLPWIQFLDHLLFIDFDVAVNKGKASGSGSRAIYSQATPSRMAKSRTLSGEPIVYGRGDGQVWDLLTARPSQEDAPPL